MTQFNKEYRSQFVAKVNSLPRDKYGRISFADAERLNKQIASDKASGIITHSDFFNCSCVVGSAVNIAPHLDERVSA